LTGEWFSLAPEIEAKFVELGSMPSADWKLKQDRKKLMQEVNKKDLTK
jgi:hypothetical protein